MIKTNTKPSTFYKLIKSILGAIALLLVTFSAEAQAYTTPNHYYGCTYERFGRTYVSYAAITTVSIADQSGNVIYSKANDNCNDNQMSGHFTVIESTSAFDLSAGSTYTLTIGARNPNNYNFYQIEVGVWLDFNSDKDFADAGEFVTPNDWRIAHNGTRSLTFTVPCGGSTNTTRMRLRSDYQYGRLYGSANHSSQLYYGETEDFTFDYV
jgi:hypothetical protein